MPEGPEIRYLSEYLNNLLIDELLARIINNDKKIEINKRVISISCKGKLLWIECEEDTYIHLHMGLTGWISDKINKYNKYILEFVKFNIYINDKIKLSKVSILDRNEHNKAINKLGIDILTENFNLNRLKEIINSHQGNIPQFLLKQNILCGIGNYIKNESLYHARINPNRKLNSLTNKEINDLYNAIRYVSFSRLYQLLKGKNSENSKFEILTNKKIKIPKDIKKISPDNLTIPYELNVHGKDKDFYENEVIYTNSIDGRGTYYVKNIQK